MKILVADDNLFYCRMLEATLTEWGYEVVTAHNGMSAWEVLQDRDAPKLAIVDWMMPGLDGLELCRRVRALQRAEPTYIILLTAKKGKENVVAGLRSGADDYINKPFDREELQARLQVGLRIVGLQGSLADRVEELESALSAAQKLEVMGRLAGGVAHDFNNLLTVILGGCDLLLGGFTQPTLLQMMKESAERGAALTRQLLAFSRRQVLVPEILQLNTLVSNLDKILHHLIGEHIRFTTHLSPDVACVRADASQIEQVLTNLCLNARDAMPSGGELVVETRNADIRDALASITNLVKPGPYVMLRVKDTGCGMDEQVQTRMFEPFFSTKPPGKGTGLGLATVYGIVKQSQGYIRVESQPGQGTTLTILLPRAEECVHVVPTRQSPRKCQGNREVILLVEDEEEVRSVARHALQVGNYEVLEARDGQDALAVSDSFPATIHLMVTDMVMPRLNGRQLAERLKPQRPAMKVLYMSGYMEESLLQGTEQLSGKQFLQKPFTPDGLGHRVRELLDS